MGVGLVGLAVSVLAVDISLLEEQCSFTLRIIALPTFAYASSLFTAIACR